MAAPHKPKRPQAWLTKAQMAAVLDVRISYFDRAIRPLLSTEHVQRERRQLRFYARGVIDAFHANRGSCPSCGSCHSRPLESEFALVDCWLGSE
ncbi:hypothetical protein Mal64_34580 [Pseudobythopirellula maris]|uniref:Uncharacterized protein n=1 Tax=Pseudobythopirellula maris TaxID=2527991 RepID=A0A5C5ZGU0_9BACT|nr:hypothetical protein [Pseudobythopirellula maris]TWT86629.1 hypothetical protein Mal64_34580 [Pseudobythopirellula maris]